MNAAAAHVTRSMTSNGLFLECRPYTARNHYAGDIENQNTFIAPTGEPVNASELPNAFGIKKPPIAPIAEMKPSAAAVSVAASRIARSSEPLLLSRDPLSVYGRSLKSSGKWNHYPAQLSGTAPGKTAKNAMKLPPCPSVGKVRNSRPLKIAIRIKFTSVTRVPPRRSDNAPPAERASAPINGPKKAYCRI